MLRNHKSGVLFILTSLSAAGSLVATASEDVPVGYKADRYQQVWERNPFTIVTPVAQTVQPKVFDKFVLVSWLNDGGNDVVFIQNIESNEVQKITKDPNSNSFRLVGIHKAADPKDAEVVLSNGTEQGSVKFRLETVTAGQQQGAPTAGVPNQVQGQGPGQAQGQGQGQGVPTPTLPGLSRQAQAALKAQQAARFGPQPVVPQTQQDAAGLPPRASEVRRKRITPPPVTQQPVGVPTVPQNIPAQPQTQ
jgi:hypothetical protein